MAYLIPFRSCLWAILQAATRGQARCLGFTFGSFHVIHLYIEFCLRLIISYVSSQVKDFCFPLCFVPCGMSSSSFMGVWTFECLGYRDKLCMVVDVVSVEGKERKRASVLRKFTLKLLMIQPQMNHFIILIVKVSSETYETLQRLCSKFPRHAHSCSQYDYSPDNQIFQYLYKTPQRTAVGHEL